MILKILRALPEKWVRENQIELRQHYIHQLLYGPYPKGSFGRARFDLCQAWTEFLFDVCVALGSDFISERGKL